MDMNLLYTQGVNVGRREAAQEILHMLFDYPPDNGVRLINHPISTIIQTIETKFNLVRVTDET